MLSKNKNMNGTMVTKECKSHKVVVAKERNEYREDGTCVTDVKEFDVETIPELVDVLEQQYFQPYQHGNVDRGITVTVDGLYVDPDVFALLFEENGPVKLNSIPAFCLFLRIQNLLFKLF